MGSLPLWDAGSKQVDGAFATVLWGNSRDGVKRRAFVGRYGWPRLRVYRGGLGGDSSGRWSHTSWVPLARLNKTATSENSLRDRTGGMVRVTRKARFFEKDRIELGREDAIRHLRGRSEGDLEMFWSLCVF